MYVFTLICSCRIPMHTSPNTPNSSFQFTCQSHQSHIKLLVALSLFFVFFSKLACRILVMSLLPMALFNLFFKLAAFRLSFLLENLSLVFFVGPLISIFLGFLILIFLESCLRLTLRLLALDGNLLFFRLKCKAK